jgi:outer membrane immunogenic protein
MYRKFLLASVGAIALTGSAAFAADLPSRAPPPVYLPPPPIFTWTGIYIGGQVGYAWGTGANRFNGFIDDAFVDTSVGGNPNGVIGGGHVGYNWQINQWVLGLEGTVDGTSLTNNAVIAFPDGSILAAHSNADIQGSIRGRLGIAWDRALIYATGGVAFGGFNTNVSLNSFDAAGVPFFVSASRSNTRTGWTVGGGIEYAITNNWSIRAEYRFTDFGTIRNGDLVGLPADVFFNGRRRLQQNQVQAGFSYKFDLFPPPPPIVAKY